MFFITVFQTNLIGLDSLHKVIDPTQLTPDLDGSLHYDHGLWIELRCVCQQTNVKTNCHR